MHEHPTTPVVVDASAAISTHISLLVLTGDRVLKFRRPVATDFCDFTTVESRVHDCEREVALNRRLTDDVYLGVGRVEVAGLEPGEAEPCVVMRRLPEDRLLSTMAEAGEDLEGPVRAIARRLATFHEAATRVTATSPDDGTRAVRERWTDAVALLRPHAHDPAARAMIDEIEHLASHWCTGRSALFRARLDDGFVRDGHGDLRAENIFCLDDGPRILDCIEFDDELRRIDVASDLAFLVMDLHRLGQVAAAETLVGEYERASGTAVPRGLLEHDVAYWALVRAKVAHLRATQGDPSAGAQAAELESLALGQLRRAQVRLVVIGGLPGTGKSTIARRLAAETGWAVVSSDEVRKEVAALPTTARTGDAFGTGLYRPDRVAAVYTEMLRRARRGLEHGRSVILDASWSRSNHRADAASLALVTDSTLHEIRCTVDEDIAVARLIARAEADTDASDADPKVARRMAANDEPWPTATAIDTAAPVGTVTALVRDALGVTKLG
jgi:aminoglycoside phosphotransferase family enzyme/predicted kinase